MKIVSADKQSSVEIRTADSSDPYSGIVISLDIETPDGTFHGKNNCIHFSDFDRFLSEFATFLNTREGEVLLDATEDCKLQFFRWNKKGDVGLRVTVSRFMTGTDPDRTTIARASGEFKIDSEFLNQVLLGFRRMKGA